MQGETQLNFIAEKHYIPPSWASHLNRIPASRFLLGHLPTPIHRWNIPDLPKGTELWLKRDDLTGMQLSGNKVRKLEFLLADARAHGADCIVTIGGIQSNHCRATAVAAKYLDLDCFLILRTADIDVDKDPGLIGNLLIERMVGAHINLVSREEYSEVGSVALTSLLAEKLKMGGRKPYVIPVGGSNSLGTWGYIEAVHEIEQQIQTDPDILRFDDIVVPCGSGGTVAGLAVGLHLSSLNAKLHAYSVCDDPDYFHGYIQCLLDELKSGQCSRDAIDVQEAKGLGYAVSTEEELLLIKSVAETSGVILDPVYSGKAVYGMLQDMGRSPSKWEGRRVLFVHTGGLFGIYDKVDQVGSLVGSCGRLDIPADLKRKAGTGRMS